MVSRQCHLLHIQGNRGLGLYPRLRCEEDRWQGAWAAWSSLMGKAWRSNARMG